MAGKKPPVEDSAAIDKAEIEAKAKADAEAQAKAEAEAKAKAKAKADAEVMVKAEAEAKTKANAEVPVLAIKTKSGSFRRCGFRFNEEPTLIALDILTEEQVELLNSEPNLVVEEGSALVDEAE